MIKDIIVSEYQSTILSADIPTELKRSLKYHERVPQFILNLEKEIKSYKKLFREKEIRLITHSLTNLFIASIKQIADEAYLSDLEKSRLLKKEAEKVEFNKFADKILEEENEQFTKEEKGLTGRSTHEI